MRKKYNKKRNENNKMKIKNEYKEEDKSSQKITIDTIFQCCNNNNKYNSNTIH